MARGDKSKSMSADKKTARTKQRKMQASGVSRRVAEDRAWDQVNVARSKRQTGTAGGRSKVSKRTTKPKGSTSKENRTNKSRR
jgi:hypothetical protein